MMTKGCKSELIKELVYQFQEKTANKKGDIRDNHCSGTIASIQCHGSFIGIQIHVAK